LPCLFSTVDPQWLGTMSATHDACSRAALCPYFVVCNCIIGCTNGEHRTPKSEAGIDEVDSHSGFSPVVEVGSLQLNPFNGNDILDAPVFRSEEQDVYSLQRDTARALQRSAMDANDGNISLLAERTVVECFRAINISLLRSKDRCVKYIRFNGFEPTRAYERGNRFYG
jgi:hypothetical protein